jgi:hypothetical protein
LLVNGCFCVSEVLAGSKYATIYIYMKYYIASCRDSDMAVMLKVMHGEILLKYALKG